MTEYKMPDTYFGDLLIPIGFQFPFVVTGISFQLLIYSKKAVFISPDPVIDMTTAGGDLIFKENDDYTVWIKQFTVTLQPGQYIIRLKFSLGGIQKTIHGTWQIL